tara:strand:- start:235 stop:798 length:564 start_codon:yes stop_codon:yes gene_type:complete
MAKRKRNQSKKTTFIPRHPNKYKGSYPIILRSSWEVAFAQYCDLHENVLQWASEPVQIPYHNPDKPTNSRKSLNGGKGFKMENAIYVPDFLVTFRKANGSVVTELIEIKPAKETLQEKSKNPRDIKSRIINESKWLAAGAWCRRRGIKFRIMTEEQLFGTRTKPVKVPKAPKSAKSKVGSVKTRKAK